MTTVLQPHTASYAVELTSFMANSISAHNGNNQKKSTMDHSMTMKNIVDHQDFGVEDVTEKHINEDANDADEKPNNNTMTMNVGQLWQG